MREQAADGTGTADQRREQMLRAALEVIQERGFPDTRIADVAERAGISPALVIYYFKTKDQLLTEAIRSSEDTWSAAGTRRMAAIETAAGRLEELIAMSCLPEADVDPPTSGGLWLALGAQAARHPGGASVRRLSARWCWPARRPVNSARWTRGTSRTPCPRCWTGWPFRSRSPTRRWTGTGPSS